MNEKMIKEIQQDKHYNNYIDSLRQEEYESSKEYEIENILEKIDILKEKIEGMGDLSHLPNLTEEEEELDMLKLRLEKLYERD